jgi:hypothetical protein
VYAKRGELVRLGTGEDAKRARDVESTAWRIACTPARTAAIRRSSGPRTAATMQNSAAPVCAVWRAASTSEGMSSLPARTGVSKPTRLRAEVAVLGAAAGL